MKKLLLLFLVAGPFLSFASWTDGFGDDEDLTEKCVITPYTKTRFAKVFEDVKASGYFYFEELSLEILGHFRGLPYGAGNAHCPKTKTLVHLNSFDCVTLVENYWAISYTIYQFHANKIGHDADPFTTFVGNLHKIRYFGGENCQLEDRIHYWTQALQELERSGYLFNVGIANGEVFDKKINYMSKNKDKYTGLDDWEKIQSQEKVLTEYPNYWYPKNKLNYYAPMAKNGDIISLATDIPGLDVSHTGIITVEDGRLMITHASTVWDKVVTHDLEAYLSTRSNVTGVFIYRPVFK